VRGSIRFEGQELTRLRERELQRIRGKKISLIVQNARASLNPLLPVGKQILNVYRVHMSGSRQTVEHHILRVLQAVGFKDPERVMESYPGQLSGGMAQRIVIAIAIGTSPKLVIADEPTTGLDVTVQAQVLDVATRMIEEARAAALLITHDLRIVANYCQKVAVMYGGRVVEFATVEEFFSGPLHPYSRRLLRALRSSTTLDASLTDAAPEVRADLHECQYRARCDMATALCASEAPLLRELRPGHWVECHHAEHNLSAT
jgi:oligopeptide/dipeptide ABC transporter ATP-binding protein